MRILCLLALLKGCEALKNEYVDGDGDGISIYNGDCDDDDPTINPNEVETAYDAVDQDCSGYTDLDLDNDGYDDHDVDHDGWASDCVIDDTPDEPDPVCTPANFDCNDGNGTVHPGAFETCDWVDSDCGGWDGGDWSEYGMVLQESGGDCDGDGYEGEAFGDGADCDDTIVWVYPGATEQCSGAFEGVDDDCDGEVDEGC
jgi:Putative metal-binding motif